MPFFNHLDFFHMSRGVNVNSPSNKHRNLLRSQFQYTHIKVQQKPAGGILFTDFSFMLKCSSMCVCACVGVDWFYQKTTEFHEKDF